MLTLNLLNKQKNTHKKMEKLTYVKLQMQEYLREKKFTIEEKRMVFRMRTQMENFKINFKSSYSDLTCPFCLSHEDTQEHSFRCKEIQINNQKINLYKNIFEETINLDTVKTATKITKLRKSLLDSTF